MESVVEFRVIEVCLVSLGRPKTGTTVFFMISNGDVCITISNSNTSNKQYVPIIDKELIN